MVTPSGESTIAFLAIVAFVYLAFVLGFRRAWQGAPNRAAVTAVAACGFGGWMVLAAFLARSGALAALANSPKIMAYFVVSNGLAAAVAFSPSGRRLSTQLPIALLVGFQAFRLPLELVLHSWYEQGTLPVQMTYAGANFDIFSGVAAVSAGAVLAVVPLSVKARRWVVLSFNLLGFGLLIVVMSIAMRSIPWPLRTYMNEPPVLLAFHSPYTWILPVCVAGALLGHLLVFRWLRQNWS
jgi:hypothetical protein